MPTSAYKDFTNIVTPERAKQLEEAASACRALLETVPDDASCLHILGIIECQLGRLAESATQLAKASALTPESIDMHCHYAMVLMEQENYAETIAVLKRALALQADHSEAIYLIANAYRENGQLVEAIAAYQQVLRLKPDYVEALNNLGNILNDRGDLAEAIDCYRRAIAARPEEAIGYNNMGLALAALGELDAAEAHYRRALVLKPHYPEALNNLGVVIRLMGRFSDSIIWYRKALALRPDYSEALNNLGNALRDCGQLDEAIQSYEASLRFKDSAEYRHNLAIALLAASRFDEGWLAYEDRWKTKQLGTARRWFKQPQWKGEAANGRTLLIHSEQGFGDTLQFCRYVPMAKALGFRVILEVQPALVRLMDSLAGADMVVAKKQPLPEFDCHCPMLSLPLAFGTQPETIPAAIPYLAASEDAVEVWREKLRDQNAVMRVGLVWAGGKRLYAPDLIATDRQRSIGPEAFTPLMDLPGVQFYSLQKDGELPPPHFRLIDLMADCSDFADTAALITNLDLVISVDTAVAHLAGALGKPVWILNRFNSCWRWFQEREDSPWYPSLRLFRQPQPGDWVSVMLRVQSELEKSLSL